MVYKSTSIFAEVGTFVLDAVVVRRDARMIVAASAVASVAELVEAWAYVTLVDSPMV
jgi:hypothetical protein